MPDRKLHSRFREAVEVAARAGLVLDGWQQDVLKDASRMRGDRWAALEVAVNVARQNGKGGILEARELAGLFAWGEKLIIHSAHLFDTSLEHFRRLLDLIEGVPEFDRQVQRVVRSHGEEGIELKSKQRIRFRTRTSGGGRGFSGDCLILDEAMFLRQASHGALFPILTTRENPQVWYAGSAVDQDIHDHGHVFARLRRRALTGGDTSLAYFEWSLDAADPSQVSDDVAADPASWAKTNPALGIRITEDYLAAEHDALDARAFAVERLGVGDWPQPESMDSVVPLEAWDRLVDAGSSLENPVCFAYDVSPDRRASIAAAGRRPDGRFHVEIVQARSGTGWVVPRLLELLVHEPARIVCDGYGPAASLVRRAEEEGLTVEPVTTAEHVQACGQLVDHVDDDTLRHLGSDELRRAIRGAKTRPLGDAWAWSRKSSSTDISPLVAATLALFAAGALVEPESDILVVMA